MTYTFSIERSVTFRQCDMAGVMHFPEYFILMEECEHCYLQENGIDVMGEYLWPRISCNAEFFKPVRLGNDLLVCIDGVDVGNTSVNYSFIIKNKADDHIITMGTIKTVCCKKRDDGTIKSCKIPDDIRKVMLALA